MSDDFLRYEVNTKVRQILVSYGVDMEKIRYTCSKKRIYFYGSLSKSPQGSFNAVTVRSLIAELMRLPNISDLQFDLENWLISAEAGELNIGRRPGMHSTG